MRQIPNLEEMKPISELVIPIKTTNSEPVAHTITPKTYIHQNIGLGCYNP
jgi:hypothetical protein